MEHTAISEDRSQPVVDDQTPDRVPTVGLGAADSAERQQGEDRLRDAAEYYAYILGAFGAADFEVDARTGAVRCSAALKRLYGYPDDFPLTLDDCRACYHPDDLPQMLSVWTDARERGQRWWEREYRVMIPEGQDGPGVRWVLARGEALLGPDGELERVRGAAFDITERKRAEAALRESEARFRLMVDAVPESIWITDDEGRTEFLNKHWCDYCGVRYAPTTAAEIAASFLHPDDGPRVMAAFGEAMRTGSPFEVEQRNRSAAGEYRWFLNRANPYRDPHTGKISKWIGVGIDIHDRKLAEEDLARALAAARAAQAAAEAALRTRDQFLSIASHELRTPLTPLLGYAGMLRQRLAPALDARQRKLVETIERQAQRLNSLIETLLDVSRLQRGQFALERRPLDLAALAAHVVDDFRLTLPGDGARHRITLLDAPAPIPVLGDAGRLEEVLHNLLSNAVKYSPDGGAIRVRVARRGGDAALEVADAGIGIPAGEQTRLFEPFYRAGNISPRVSGFGLGLYIVREIVQRHGGRVEMESAEGQGTTFRVIVPLAQREPEA